MFISKWRLKKLTARIDKLVMDMEKSKIREYVCYLENPRKVFFSNFLAGLARVQRICGLYAARRSCCTSCRRSYSETAGNRRFYK